jgi:hypothetical protein
MIAETPRTIGTAETLPMSGERDESRGLIIDDDDDENDGMNPTFSSCPSYGGADEKSWIPTVDEDENTNNMNNTTTTPIDTDGMEDPLLAQIIGQSHKQSRRAKQDPISSIEAIEMRRGIDP